MKRTLLFAVSFLFVVAASSNSFGYSVLCESTAKAITANESEVTLFSCAIPANAVGVGKSIRVTANFHPSNGSSPLVVSLFLNGNDVGLFADSSIPFVEQNWSFIVTNDSNTGGWAMGGFNVVNNHPPIAFSAANTQNVHPLPWSSGWTLAFKVDFSGSGTNSYQAVGDTFVVEILN
jgi:hypothetical protein